MRPPRVRGPRGGEPRERIHTPVPLCHQKLWMADERLILQNEPQSRPAQSSTLLTALVLSMNCYEPLWQEHYHMEVAFQHIYFWPILKKIISNWMNRNPELIPRETLKSVPIESQILKSILRKHEIRVPNLKKEDFFKEKKWISG